ncbi:MAG: hypothetical protein WCI03_06680 [bacterium]
MGRFIPVIIVSFLSFFPRDVVAAPVSHAFGRTVLSSDLVREFGAVTLEMIDRLRGEIWLQIPASPQDNAEMLEVSPLEIISMRKKHPEISTLAVVKMGRIQRLTLGTAPEFVEVGRKYVLFYEGVVRGAWGVVLKQRLRRAEEALKELARQTLERKVYLDEYEQTMGKDDRLNSTESVGNDLIPGLEKCRIESYIDEADKKFGKP